MPTLTQPDALSGLHILLVDDDSTFLQVVHALLNAIGITQVTVAHSGSDAYTKLLNVDKVVDCILCDYSMSEGNGLQLLQAIRLGTIKLFRPDACFVLVTMSGDAKVVAAAAQLDVSGYLVKPVTADSLRTAITKARARPIRVDRNKYTATVLPDA